MSLAEFLLRKDMKNTNLRESRHRLRDSNLKPWVQVPIWVCAWVQVPAHGFKFQSGFRLVRLRPLMLSVSIRSAKLQGDQEKQRKYDGSKKVKTKILIQNIHKKSWIPDANIWQIRQPGKKLEGFYLRKLNREFPSWFSG